MELDNFYLKQAEPVKGCLLALRQIILDQDELVWETIKYGGNCFMYKKRMFCYLWIEKKTGWPYILMVEGVKIEHPKLEQGDRKRMKIFRMNPDEDLPIQDIKTVLKIGLDLYRDGVVKS